MNNEASKITAIKDQALGAIKETFGSVTGNPRMELIGKAQKIHGKNEYEYAQAQKHGESEPEKFRQAYHDQPSASGQVEGVEPSSFSGAVNQFVGGVKESLGSATNNHQMELIGKAQNVHGRNEAEFAKAEQNGLSEPDQFANGTKINEHAEGSVEGETASSFLAMKDRAVGAVKETIGSITGSQNMELLGKAQRVHGRNEAEFAKAERQGLSEPEQFVQGTKTTDHAEGKVEGEKPSTMSSLKDRALGSVKETLGSVTGNQTMEMIGKAQNVHGRNEAEFAKAQSQGMQEPEHFVQGTKTCDHAEGTVEGDSSSSIRGLKDRAVGAMIEAVGSITANQKMELIGKAQNVHGRNEAEFAKAENQGVFEPQHFVHGTKVSDIAEGSVEGEEASSLSAMKDRALGSIKETFGNVTGNQRMELLGKAQNVHGRNQAEFTKAQSNGLAEPEEFVHGTKTCEQAEGSVESSSNSSFSTIKDRAVGNIVETVGKITSNHEMELIGKAQSVHGRNVAEFVNAEKSGRAEPEEFIKGTKTCEHAVGTVEYETSSSFSSIKDRTVGAVKEMIGSATDNHKIELLGKAQNVHGRNAAEFSKAQRCGEIEPEHFSKGTKSFDQAEGSVEGENMSALSALKDRTVGAVKETLGGVMNDEKMELLGRAQRIHGRNEAEFAKAESKGLSEPSQFVHGTKTTDHADGSVEQDRVSTLSSVMDRAVGTVKESFGSITGDQKTELKGKAQQVHARNAADFAKAESKGLIEPEHFAESTNSHQHATGSVEDTSISAFSAVKDQTVGAVKVALGSATGNQNMELVGKAQSVHARNASEFAKAERNGQVEPQHFGRSSEDDSMLPTEDDVSKLSAYKDRLVGSVKEKVGSVMQDHKMELTGKAQNVHGRNAVEFAEQHQVSNA